METITSRKNPLIIHMKKLGSDRSYRYECGEFVCQGLKLYVEALRHSVGITAVLFCSDEPQLPEGARCAKVPRDILESISSMDSVPDIIFSCRMPAAGNSLKKGRHIILEDLQDPGNVGTIIRTANAFMMDSVILTGGSADPYNPKTVRATMGAVFRQTILQIPLNELLPLLKKENIPLFATGLDSSCISVDSVPKKSPVAVAIGNEGKGLGPELFAASEKRLMIPMNPACESLNAAIAAAVIMWELYK